MTSPSSLSLKKIYSGKVRDLYEIDDKRMLMVATDRLSAFDVILAEPIPEKGKILTAISNFWFDKLAQLVPNHFTGDKVEDVVPAEELPQVEGRAVVAKRLKPVAVEAIVRGYIVGSGWKEYQRSGTIADTKFEFGLDENGELTLMDEVLTPDSSRFWPADSYAEGSNPPSFDKQFVRDWLESTGWNKEPPAPPVPADVAQKTADKYREALTRLTS
jgi:phosphoribosylaminoimidazole-succinocarboxamide synthase